MILSKAQGQLYILLYQATKKFVLNIIFIHKILNKLQLVF